MGNCSSTGCRDEFFADPYARQLFQNHIRARPAA
jgi:hypothetical protein